MQKREFKERRAFQRIPIKLSLRILNLRSKRESLTQTVDISANGIGLIAENKLYPNTPLEIWLQTPDAAEPLHTKGEVVWAKMLEPNSFRVGVRLEKTDLLALSQALLTM
jgi:hypothetical protein